MRSGLGQQFDLMVIPASKKLAELMTPKQKKETLGLFSVEELENEINTRVHETWCSCSKCCCKNGMCTHLDGEDDE